MADDHTDRHVRRVSLINTRIGDDSCHLSVWGWWIRRLLEYVSISLGDWCQRGKWSTLGVIIIIPSSLGLTSGLVFKMILAISLCEVDGYVACWSTCPSASATDANVGNGPPLVLSSSSLPALAWSVAFGSYEASEELGRMISYVAPDGVLYVYLSSWRVGWDSVKKIR